MLDRRVFVWHIWMEMGGNECARDIYTGSRWISSMCHKMWLWQVALCEATKKNDEN